MIVRIERYFKYPDLKRQTPSHAMQWNDITFTEEAVDSCDYLVILEYPGRDFSVRVDPRKVLHLCQEPPNEISKYRQYANKKVSVIYNQLDTRNKNVLSHGALPWHVDKDYDFLKNLSAANLSKEDKLVWVTSNQRGSKGHQARMEFLDHISDLPFLELFGRGIKPIDDKWSVLSTAKYAIAYENFHNDYYWTEKISDCFLSYTLPLYFGCKEIGQFFPKDSYIQLDPNDRHIKIFLRELMATKKWEQSLDAITQARNAILDQYQLFPFLTEQIQSRETVLGGQPDRKELLSFKGKNQYFDNIPMSVQIQKQLLRIQGRIGKLFK